MAKVQVVQHFVRNASAHYQTRFKKPSKVHFPHQKDQIYSENRIPKSKNDSKAESNTFKDLLKYYSANKLSVAVHCVALIMLSITIAMETQSYRMRPVATSVEDDMYPVQKINFPGVSICNINVVSREEAMHFAETLWMNQNVKAIANLTLETVKYVVRYMGALYQFEHKENHPGDLMLLHEILQKAFFKDYNVMGIMKTLTPKCRTFLMDCFWQGYSRNCDELFVSRWTPEGYCCSFNHVRWTDRFNDEQDADFKINVERSQISGTEYGLYVTLRPDLDDYYYTTLPGRGFKVLLYTASDYPDAPSGGLREVLISPGSESFLNIKATTFYSSLEVLKYDKQKRQCLFKTELNEIYGGSYSYSQCMMFCRVSDVRKICGCIPFFYPFPDDISDVRMCNVNDLMCLQQYRYKWWSFEPIASEFTENQNRHENEDNSDAHLKCDCWPSCENVDYTVFKTSSSIHNTIIPWTNRCTNKNLTRDNIVLSVSFASTGTVRLRQDVMFYWFELMSNYGGLCSLFLGISIMTPIELAYLLCLRFWSRTKTRILPRNQHTSATPVKIKTHVQPIYWSEIMLPKRCI